MISWITAGVKSTTSKADGPAVTKAAVAPTLVIDRVCKRFGEIRAVDEVSLQVQPATIVALLGPNGAGKTTLIRMLVGILRPDAGTVRFTFDGRQGAVLPPTLSAYLPEDRGLYGDVAVRRTLAYFGVLRGMDPNDAALAADAWLERLGLQDRRDAPLKELSKGNQQKVQFASAILHRPRFAILDEPFSGLDPLNQDLFIDLIRELREEGASVLLSAHQMQLVERVADRVIIVNLGRRILDDDLDGIRARWGTDATLHDVYVRLVRAETGDPQ
jgi:ABC-2 type transport system ATP-binding protein